MTAANNVTTAIAQLVLEGLRCTRDHGFAKVARDILHFTERRTSLRTGRCWSTFGLAGYLRTRTKATAFCTWRTSTERKETSFKFCCRPRLRKVSVGLMFLRLLLGRTC